MEVGGALAAAAVSLPCLVILLVLGEAGLRVASLALRGWYGRPTRAAFLGYRITRPAGSGSSHYPVFRDDDEPPLPPECCDRLPRAAYRRRQGAAAEPVCAFCLSAVRDGAETRELRCRHVFHRACLDAWLVRPRATCPLCRDRLLPADPAPRDCTAAAHDDDLDGYFVDDDLSPPSSADAHGSALRLHLT